MAPATRQRDSTRERLIDLVRVRGVIRPRDAAELGIAREYLRRLKNEGILEQPGRGLYVLAGSELTELQSVAEVCKKVPHAVICLLSALQYHGLTTQMPHEVWIAIGNRTWEPKLDTVQLRVTRYSASSLAYGVQEASVSGVTIRVFNPAKTIADCFKFRNKVGLDVAIEALRDGLSKRIVNMDELWNASEVCRVAKVIRPYLESLA